MLGVVLPLAEGGRYRVLNLGLNVVLDRAAGLRLGLLVVGLGLGLGLLVVGLRLAAESVADAVDRVVDEAAYLADRRRLLVVEVVVVVVVVVGLVVVGRLGRHDLPAFFAAR